MRTRPVFAQTVTYSYVPPIAMDVKGVHSYVPPIAMDVKGVHTIIMCPL